MRTYKTTQYLAPLDEWYRVNKLRFTPTQVEKYDVLYDNVLEMEDEENDNDLQVRVKKLNDYVETIKQSWPNEE